jgi:hypothetical protein
MRARMRKKLLPLLERQFNRAVVEHLAALAERAHEHASLVDDLAGHLFEKSVVLDGSSARIGVSAMFSPFGVQPSAASSVLRAKLIQEIAAEQDNAAQISAGTSKQS